MFQRKLTYRHFETRDLIHVFLMYTVPSLVAFARSEVDGETLVHTGTF
jgi:hypothetical protein